MVRITKTIHQRIFVMLLLLVLVLSSIHVARARGLLVPEQQILLEGRIVDLSSLTLEQKIAQMLVVAGQEHNLEAW